MKRFLLFSGERCYPLGGWDDFGKDYDTAAEAEAEGRRLVATDCDWFHVIDTQTMLRVADGYRRKTLDLTGHRTGISADETSFELPKP